MKKTASISHQEKHTAIRLNRNLEKHLLAYVIAASAGLLSSALPAEAEVVYTPSNIPMAQGFAGGALTSLDLNNDGVPDFTFSNFSYSTHGNGNLTLTLIPAQAGNEMWGVKIPGQHRVTAAALSIGVQVGPKGNFASYPQGLNMANIAHGTMSGSASGSWLNVETAYLGLKFMIDGEVHYGWARVKFPYAGGDAFLGGSIYGYAYETVPNQPIVVGEISNSGALPQSVSSASPNENHTGVSQSLGRLAAGARARAPWRGQPSRNLVP